MELAAELRMPHVVKPWDDKDNQLLQHDLELIWAFWVIFFCHQEEADAAARAAEEDAEATEEDPGAVPAADHRPNWVREILQEQTALETRQTALEQRQTTFEQGIADLTKAIRDSYLSATERHGRAQGRAQGRVQGMMARRASHPSHSGAFLSLFG
ncbi:hypothetical protein LWI29_019745 [Acer saccharum]|uniref:Uncharacterized protein n=1 Tax=Acer saccharum TaxID=4024 RepID=A0AA39RSF6_ACESA|nr:hypothetical protein LWI29_019745 [Acer saccharum]